MPLYVWSCSVAHRFEKVMSVKEMTLVDDGFGTVFCPFCQRKRRCRVVPAPTGAPILREGVGGFYKPTPEDK